MQNNQPFYLLFLLFFSLSVLAEEVKSTTPSITELIQQVKSAKVEDKRVLMNQLKLQLREMNKETRSKAMKELKKSFASKKGHLKNNKKHQKQKNIKAQQSKHQPKYKHIKDVSTSIKGKEHKNGKK